MMFAAGANWPRVVTPTYPGFEIQLSTSSAISSYSSSVATALASDISP